MKYEYSFFLLLKTSFIKKSDLRDINVKHYNAWKIVSGVAISVCFIMTKETIYNQAVQLCILNSIELNQYVYI